MTTVNQESVLRRLARIEGQIRGLQRMVAEGQPCSEILTQVAAARAALAGVATMIFEVYSKSCIEQAVRQEEGCSEALEDMLRSLSRLLK
ncbi:MAG: metal-sensitive transcriptional regulator [Limnochordia bacterium]|nr:metal-sensitive transcriptional regulator [Limnochordia bacterium]MDI9465413.1 metal-sensitive transcriptional regulator [Bacillota bacterium]NLO95951.1 metal-sensitive transcriptional regulator [Bacillota bacterium]HOB39604.1 metal-sensitive transcriptional regulator [Limnochordia bacterium]HOK30485.1 metal-sensitive transcriptional regulator [Limnochordia bacterium]